MLVTTTTPGESIGRTVYILDTDSGIEYTLEEACRRCGVKRSLVWQRRYMLGWSWFDALHTPVGRSKRHDR